MTLLSGYLLPTEREPPADAEAISHKLMVRAGLVRQIGSGLVEPAIEIASIADAELLGRPLRLTVGRPTLGAGEIEVQLRRGRESRSVPISGAAEAVARLWRELP